MLCSTLPKLPENWAYNTGMKTYTEFIEWAAQRSLEEYQKDDASRSVSWGASDLGVLAAGAEIYGRTVYDINQDIRARLEEFSPCPWKN